MYSASPGVVNSEEALRTWKIITATMRTRNKR